MQSIDITSRLSEAIARCTELQRDKHTEINAARTRVATAKQAYEEAETRSAEIARTSAIDLKTIKKRQMLLGRLLGQDGNMAVEEALQPLELSNGTASLVKPTLPTPPKSATFSPPTKSEIKLIPAHYANDPGYVENHTIIVPYNSAYAEIRCKVCNTNIDPNRKTFMKGASGVQKHLQRAHEQKMDVKTALEKSIHRLLSKAEAERIVSGEVELDRVADGSITNARVRGSGAIKQNSGVGKRKRTMPVDEEAAYLEEPVAKKRDVKVEKGDEEESLSPEAAARLREFRELKTHDYYLSE